MTNLFRVPIAMLLTLVLLTAQSCGPLSRVSDLMDKAAPYVNSQVASGFIPSNLLVPIKADFNDTKAAVNRAKARLDAIPSSDSNKKIKVASVYFDLSNDFRLIVARNHFAQANSVGLNTVVNLVSDILNILAQRNSPTFGGGGDDSELKEKLRQLENELDKR
jgi:hypothetical protein